MKYLFQRNTTTIENDYEWDDTTFRIKTVSSVYDDLSEDIYNDILEEASSILPSKKLIITAIILIVGYCITALAGEWLSIKALRWISLVFSFANVILLGLYSRKVKIAMKGDEFQQKQSRLKELHEIYKQDMGVPEDAKKIDILKYDYIVKKRKGRERIYSKHTADYWNEEMLIYFENDMLCLAVVDEVFGFPVAEIASISCKKRKITFENWNKEEKWKAREYKKYRIREKKSSYYVMRSCCEVRILHEGEEYRILLPGYEEETVRSIMEESNKKGRNEYGI